MDDGSLVLLGLAAIVAFFLGPIGFFLTLGARARLTKVEALQWRVSRLEKEIAVLKGLKGDAPREPRPDARAEPEAAPATAPPAEETTSPSPAPTVEPEIAATAPPPLDDVLTEPSPKAPVPPPLPAPRPKIDLEEKLGAHWAVIV